MFCFTYKLQASLPICVDWQLQILPCTKAKWSMVKMQERMFTLTLAEMSSPQDHTEGKHQNPSLLCVPHKLNL